MMRFNLAGITVTDNQSKSDHTPTPTRFIRNCEELGLFQDLQNVNPFEEGFRKALNSVGNKKLTTLESVTNNYDSLHTPNILPTSLAAASKRTEVNESSNDNSVFELKITDNESGKEESPKVTEMIDISKDSSKGSNHSGLKCKERLERRRESNRKAARKAYTYRNEMIAKNQLELVRLRDENAKLKLDNASLNKEVKKLRQDFQTVSSNIRMEEHKGVQYEKSTTVSSISEDAVSSSSIKINGDTSPQTIKPRFILPKIARDERGRTGNVICINNSFVLVNSSKP